MATLEFALLAFASIIALTEPTSTIPEFLSVTKDLDAKKRNRLALKAAVISFSILVFFALTGHLLFVVFNISHDAFTIAGGIFLIYVAFGMFRSKKEQSTDESERAAVVPLAFPLTAGPGAITTVILLVARASSLIETSIVFIAIGVAMLVVYVGLVFSSKLAAGLSSSVFEILPALISIFVLAIGVQFIINGIIGVASTFPP